MQYRQLGKTSVHVSEIGLGCSGYWGDKAFPERKAISVVEKALECGINFFDTGCNYSNFNAEPRLGNALKLLLPKSKRSDIIISTKAGSNSGYAPTIEDNDTRFSNYTPKAIEASCIRSIRNLNCEYIDVFQLHGFDKSSFTESLMECLLSLKERGLIRYIGVNTHYKCDLSYINMFPHIFDMVLTDCNVLQLDRFEILDNLAQNGIGVTVGTVLAQGYLVSPQVGSIFTGSFFWYLARTLLKPTTRDFALHSGPMRKALSLISDMTAAQAAFAYILHNRSISSCLFGTTNTKNLTEVAEASGKKLSAEGISIIENTYSRLPSSLSR